MKIIFTSLFLLLVISGDGQTSVVSQNSYNQASSDASDLYQERDVIRDRELFLKILNMVQDRYDKHFLYTLWSRYLASLSNTAEYSFEKGEISKSQYLIYEKRISKEYLIMAKALKGLGFNDAAKSSRKWAGLSNQKINRVSRGSQSNNYQH